MAGAGAVVEPKTLSNRQDKGVWSSACVLFIGWVRWNSFRELTTNVVFSR